MGVEIFKNSYIMAIFSFVILYIIFYLSGIGYTITYKDDREIKVMSYKYPLILSLIIWMTWHFILFPHPDTVITKPLMYGSSGPEMLCDKWT